MRMIHYVRAGCLAAALGTCMLVAGLARADVTTERPGSILIFPKVVNAGSRDTIVHITNTGNSIDNVHCFYLDGQPGPNGQQSKCAETDFDLSLTRQQPTHWVASKGRSVDPSDHPGSNGAGLDPGIIPPVATGFTGALVCVEIDDAGAPTGQNKLKGEATLDGPAGDVAKYSAIAVQAIPAGFNPTCVISGKPCSSDSDCTAAKDSCNINVLQLDNTQYNACSNAAQFNFIPDGAPDPIIEALGNAGICSGGPLPGAPCSPLGTCATGANAGNPCSAATATTDCGAGVICTNTDCAGGTCTTGQSLVANTVTVLPCNLDFQNQVPTKFKLSYLVTDGDETQVSFSDASERQCWASINLADIPPARFGTGQLLGPLATVLLTTAEGGPFFFVGETVRFDAAGNSARAAANLHTEGTCHGVTGDPVPCLSNPDCAGVGTSACDLTNPATIRLPSLP